MTRIIVIILFIFLSDNASADVWIDSIARESEILVSGVVIDNTVLASHCNSAAFTCRIRVLQVGRGGRNTNVPLPNPGDTIVLDRYISVDTGHSLNMIETFLFPLNFTASRHHFALSDSGYNYYAFNWYGNDGLSPYDEFNLLERLTPRSLKLDDEGSVLNVIIEINGIISQKVESTMDGKIISIITRISKPKKEIGPTVTVFKVREFNSRGKKISCYRSKLKQYGIGTKISTWTFRKNGIPKLKYSVFHDNHTF